MGRAEGDLSDVRTKSDLSFLLKTDLHLREWLARFFAGSEDLERAGFSRNSLTKGRVLKQLGKARIVLSNANERIAGIIGTVDDPVAKRRADVSIDFEDRGEKLPRISARASTESTPLGPCVAALLYQAMGDVSEQEAEPEWFSELAPNPASAEQATTDLPDDEPIDWWQFECGVVLGGQRINLLPGIVTYLRSQPEDFAQRSLSPNSPSIDISLGEGFGTVAVPADRFDRIMSVLGDLLNGGLLEEDGSLRVHRVDAEHIHREPRFLTTAPEYVFHADEDIRTFEQGSSAEAPKGFHATLRPYQAEGVAWLQFLRRKDLGGVLADDMGLGKTIQTLCHLLLENVEGRADLPCLIVAPKSVVPNWEAETKKFAPSLSVLALQGESRQRKRYHAVMPHADLVVTSYPVLLRDIEVLSAQPFHVVVLDEAQTIKNSRARVSKAACQLESRHRLCLSGTPLENHLGELWSLFEFLMPGFLGNKDAFDSRYRRPIEEDRDEAAQMRLAERISPLVLRRTKALVAKDLPPKTTLIDPVELTDEQMDLYEAVRVSVSRELRKAIEEQGWNKSQILVLDALLKLRQICCHPGLLKFDAAQKVTRSAKLEAFVDKFAPMARTGSRILVFSQFSTMLGIISDTLEKEGIPHLILTGDSKDRGELCKKFQSGKWPVFLISLRAGGTGLNLTVADTVVHYDPWWNPALEAQATDRAYRIGQKNPVFVHKMICSGTIEEKIVLLQQKKRALADALLEGTPTKLDFTEEELGNLLAPIRASS